MVRLPYVTALTTLFSYGLLFAFGQFRDFFRKIIDWFKSTSKDLKGYAPICLGLEDFYTRRLYLRIQDCFSRPIASAPDAWFDVVERYTKDNNKTLHRTSKTSKCLNLGSYNYLGFAAADEYCTPRVIESLKKYSPSTCSIRVDGGTTDLHTELELLVARFVGKPAAITFGMGYVTNSAIIPVLIGKGGLIISDSLNHNSIVNGARGSGAAVRVFQHNNAPHLEEVLREQIAEGQPRTHRPWKKIIVIVEGIYSMEGELCQLPEIIAVCKKYKVYTYLDEAHSIGAVGKSGKGVCELLGVDPADVDIMMGTFTKSFGSCGGYIAASKEIVQYLKHACPAQLYATSMSPPAVQQVISALKARLGFWSDYWLFRIPSLAAVDGDRHRRARRICHPSIRHIPPTPHPSFLIERADEMDEVLTSADVAASNASVAHGSSPPLSSNLPLVSAVLAFSVAQFLKLFTTWYKDKRWDSRRLLGSGGMPSSHSATVVALAVAVGLQEGIGSTTFALAVILASIVMYDASGIRLHAGRQAELLNQIVCELPPEHPVSNYRPLHELLGHTKLQVCAGALLGCTVSFLLRSSV